MADVAVRETPSTKSTLVFGISAAVLLVAAVGLRPTIDALRTRYTKSTIELRRPLDMFNTSELPSFRRAPDDTFMTLLPSSAEALGTDQYAMFNLQEKGSTGREGHTVLLLTYYSNPGDKVPHTPEVCYRQTGGIVRDLKHRTVPTPGLGPDTPEIYARTLYLEQAHSRAAIAYCFCANGDFVSDRVGARLRIAWPGDKYVYFSKVEAVSRFEQDSEKEEAMRRSERLLAEAMPLLIEKHFPETAVVRGER